MARIRKRRKGFPTALSKLVKKVYPAPEQFEEARVIAWWARAVPARVLKNARPVRMRHGMLYVNVSSASWAQELTYLADDLIARVRAFAPDAGVRGMRFSVGPLPPVPVVPKDPLKRRRVPIKLAVLPDDLGRALATVADDELRDLLAEVATTSLTQRPDET